MSKKVWKEEWDRLVQNYALPAKQDTAFDTQQAPVDPAYGSYGFHDMLQEDAVSPNELPEDINVSVKFTPKNHAMIFLTDMYGSTLDHKSGAPIYGMMWLSYEDVCGGMMIQWVKASQGFGPLLYDIAMELCDKHDTWLMSDRNSVTPEALDIWIYYDQKRNDVEKEPLPKNQGYPECSFRAAIKAAKKDPYYTNWERHPLAFKWRKPQHDVLTQLENLGKLKHVRGRVREDLVARFDQKEDQVMFKMSIENDSFIHFTTAKRAGEIMASNKLLQTPPYRKFGTDTVDAISLTYGTFLPSVQTTHITKDEGQIIAIWFKTDVLPDIGFVEEVKWSEDVPFTESKLMTAQRAISKLQDTPEYERVSKLDWGYVEYYRKKDKK